MRYQTMAFLGLFFLVNRVASQVVQTTVVEHFTNTNCSICANRNPGFYNNLKQQQGVIYLSIHPSAPYSSCKLSQENKPDNDARTNFYSVYGSTPRIVINGNVISSSSNYSSDAIFSPYKGKTTAFKIAVNQHTSADSVQTRISITCISDPGSVKPAQLFVSLAEDTVFYTGGNGEKLHFNVHRKSVYGDRGIAVILPKKIGDSMVFVSKNKINNIWNATRIRTIAILQDSATKSAIQAGASAVSEMQLSTKDYLRTSQIVVYPNPAFEKIYVPKFQKFETYSLRSLSGNHIASGDLLQCEFIDIHDIAHGIYLLQLMKGNEIHTLKITIEK